MPVFVVSSSSLLIILLSSFLSPDKKWSKNCQWTMFDCIMKFKYFVKMNLVRQVWINFFLFNTVLLIHAYQCVYTLKKFQLFEIANEHLEVKSEKTEWVPRTLTTVCMGHYRWISAVVWMNEVQKKYSHNIYSAISLAVILCDFNLAPFFFSFFLCSFVLFSRSCIIITLQEYYTVWL